MKSLVLAVLAALLGAGALVWLAPQAHPAREWTFRFDREQAIALAAAQAVALGVPTQGWSVYVEQDMRSELEYYKRFHSQDPAARPLSPHMADVVFASPDHKRSISIHLFPDGRIASWERREAGAKEWNMKSMQSAVDAAFHLLAGADAANYRPATENAATKEGLRFTWERAGASADFQPTIVVVVQDGAVTHAETHYTFSRAFDGTFDRRDSSMDWFNLAYGVLYFVLGLCAVILYTVGSIRRRVNQRFAIAFAAVNLVSVVITFWLGSGWEHVQSIRALQSLDDYVNAWTGLSSRLVAGLLLALAIAGGGLFGSGVLRDQWWSLRLLLSRRVFSKQVGLSVSAGILTSPLLCAIPLLINAVVPSTLWAERAIPIFSAHPAFESFRDLMHPAALIFFGVVFGMTWNGIRSASLRFALIAPCAVLFFIGFHDTLHAPTFAIVLQGGLLAAWECWLFLRFGLLAIVAAETGLTLLNLAVPAWLQPSPGLQSIGWESAGLLLALLCAGLVLLRKAPDVSNSGEAGPEPLTVQSQREELQSEFLVAQRAQREMLPSEPPQIPGFSLAASCTPAREVGGDLYDFLPLSQGRLAIAVADVSGKGVPAALYMTLTKGLLAATTQEGLDLSSILEHINTHLCTVGKRKTFVTMALGILDPATRSVEYGRAGHNPAVWHRPRAGTTSLLSSKGLGLGITAGRVFGRTLIVEKLDLEAGDTLVFYSDGLTEAMNADLEQFGEQRLMGVVEKVGALAAAPARDAILREVAEFLDGRPAQDDLTLVVLHVD